MKTIVLMISLLLGVSVANAQSRVAIKSNDLPKAITENVSTQHPGYAISNAYRVDEKGVMTYEVFAKKDNDMLRMVYDKDGKFMRMSDHKAAQSHQMRSGNQMHSTNQMHTNSQNRMMSSSQAKAKSDPPNVAPDPQQKTRIK